ncbi:MAG: T9SS type A sorting domain-containing protein [Bacteroidales bacterium]|nr:T9SS type A sorting domain-containing protein [Bacteroidales bacterium]
MKTKLSIFILILNVLSLKATIGQPIYTDTNNLIIPEFFDLPCSYINLFNEHAYGFTNYISDVFTIYSIAQPFRVSGHTPIKSVVFKGATTTNQGIDHYEIDTNAYYIQVWDHNFSNLIYQVRYDTLINEDNFNVRFREVFFDSTIIVDSDFYIAFTVDTSLFSQLIRNYTMFSIYPIKCFSKGECDPEDYKYPLLEVKLAGSDEWIYLRDIPYPSHLDSLLYGYNEKIQHYQRTINLAALLVFPRIDTAYVLSSSSNQSIGTDMGENISIFPNPTKNILNVESTVLIKEIELVNPLGQALFKNNAINSHNYQINLENYPTGTYLIKVLTNSGQTTKKVIKE